MAALEEIRTSNILSVFVLLVMFMFNNRSSTWEVRVSRGVGAAEGADPCRGVQGIGWAGYEWRCMHFTWQVVVQPQALPSPPPSFTQNQKKEKTELSNENLMINELIKEYLKFNGYNHTCSVFMAGNVTSEPTICLVPFFFQKQDSLQKVYQLSF